MKFHVPHKRLAELRERDCVSLDMIGRVLRRSGYYVRRRAIGDAHWSDEERRRLAGFFGVEEYELG